jgi:hypothetical protein
MDEAAGRDAGRAEAGARPQGRRVEMRQHRRIGAVGRGYDEGVGAGRNRPGVAFGHEAGPGPRLPQRVDVAGVVHIGEVGGTSLFERRNGAQKQSRRTLG